MKCGDCLVRDVKMVDLVNGVCPKCGADYRDDLKEEILASEPKPSETPTPAPQ